MIKRWSPGTKLKPEEGRLYTRLLERAVWEGVTMVIERAVWEGVTMVMDQWGCCFSEAPGSVYGRLWSQTDWL